MDGGGQSHHEQKAIAHIRPAQLPGSQAGEQAAFFQQEIGGHDGRQPGCPAQEPAAFAGRSGQGITGGLHRGSEPGKAGFPGIEGHLRLTGGIIHPGLFHTDLKKGLAHLLFAHGAAHAGNRQGFADLHSGRPSFQWAKAWAARSSSAFSRITWPFSRRYCSTGMGLQPPAFSPMEETGKALPQFWQTSAPS